MDNLAETTITESETDEMPADVMAAAEEFAKAIIRLSVDEEYRKEVSKNIS
jgi:hypothetical protein